MSHLYNLISYWTGTSQRGWDLPTTPLR